MVVPIDDAAAPHAERIGVRASVAVHAIERIAMIALEAADSGVMLDADAALGLIQRVAEARRWDLRDAA
jgi:hypothetical protein